MRGHALCGVDGEAAFDEFAGGEGDGAPVFEGGEAVVGDEDGLHFFEVGVPVEGGVAAEEEVGYYADGPDVAGWGSGVLVVGFGRLFGVGEGGKSYTGFPCPDFLKISGAMYPGVPQVVVRT